MPRFTVITATWNRSRHIVPTIRSVLAQDFTDFEYLIIGDCCTDDTEDIVRPFLSDRVRWLSTSERWRSQSGPNNLGIEQAKGDFIAYLGHDDIWSPDHLAAHFAVLARPSRPAFSVSGYISHGCPGTGIVAVRGLFSEREKLESYLFAPSCLAHRRDLIEQIGNWRKPDEIDEGVDTDLLYRASAAGMSFVPTGKITMHKFEAVQRYLSYLDHESDEQEAILAQMSAADFGVRVSAWIEASKAQGTFAPSYSTWKVNRPKAGIAAFFRESRGVTVPELVAVGRRLVLHQVQRPGASDWRHGGPDAFGFRWSGPNPAPRALVPVTSLKPVHLMIELVHSSRRVLEELRFQVNQVPIAAKIERIHRKGNGHRAVISLAAELRESRPSVLRIFQPAGAMIGDSPAKMTGVGLGKIIITCRDASRLDYLLTYWFHRFLVRISR